MQSNTVLIAGGAGFIGSHLCAHYLSEGMRVVCADNLSTGRKENIEPYKTNPQFSFVKADISAPLSDEITREKYDIVLNFASPASPPKYQELAIETLMVGAVGTKNLLDLARRDKARFVQASTSEVYGDPSIHPQREDYYGNVNSYGPRAMYDEAKRFGEALVYSYKEKFNVFTAVPRIFNTYGPNMDPEDGRVVSNFIMQALKHEPLTIYGDGSQTRSFCYISDLVDGIVKLVNSEETGPINIGNPDEFTVSELATQVLTLIETNSKPTYHPLPVNDPLQRCPDITLAKKQLAWEPQVGLMQGLAETIDYFSKLR